MANQTNINVTRSKENLNNKDNAFQNYPPSRTTSRKSQSRENPLNDDLIVSLSNAYENRRAQQVTEWESRQNVRYAA